MEVLVVGHPEAVLGFSLAGIRGQAATNAAEANEALDAALANRGIGIVLVTSEVAAMIEPRMSRLKLRSNIPLVVEIPGPAGVPADQPSLNELVFRAIGIKI
jgi:V/A-type H+/Na+-transporting ATPase subunit F